MENKYTVKKREIKGYHNFAHDQSWDGSYESLLEKRKSALNSDYFKMILEILNLNGTEKILDFGAGTCWASYIFSELGCNVIALEMNASEICGLGTIKNYKKNAEITFDVIIGDCEQPPLKENTFDVAFCCQALHHAYDLNKIVDEIGKTVKIGGLLIAMGEHIRPPFSDEKKFREGHPAFCYGANERAYPARQYIKAFKEAGLVDVVAIPRGFENDFETIRQVIPRKIIQLSAKIPFIGKELVRHIILFFSGAGTEITIYGRKA